jgi:hypothetical protein
LITPPIPYQALTLPPLDPANVDRTLPAQLPSIGASFFFRSCDTGTQKILPKTVLQQQGTPPTTRITPFDALLQASELAQDADFNTDQASAVEALYSGLDRSKTLCRKDRRSCTISSHKQANFKWLQGWVPTQLANVDYVEEA